MFGCLPWWVRLEWRVKRRWVLALCTAELLPTIVALTLFGIADPNTYRTKLWQEGSDHGWNSDPSELLYAAANYRPISAPLPWNQFVTDWNVVIAILSTFILIVKVVMFLTHTFPPMFSAFLHAGLVVVWAYSASLQSAPDYTDPQHPSRMPWYLTHGCGAPVSEANQGYCQQAKAAFGITIIEVVLFFGFFVFSVYMSFPSKEQKQRRAEKEQEAREWAEIENFDDKQFNFELDQMHMPMQTPASMFFPTGAGVLQQQPGTPAKGYFGASVSEQELQLQQQQQYHQQQEYYQEESEKQPLPQLPEPSYQQHLQESRPNRDLPLRHHYSSDVYK